MANLTKEQRLAKEAEEKAKMQAEIEAKIRAEYEEKLKAAKEELKSNATEIQNTAKIQLSSKNLLAVLRILTSSESSTYSTEP